MVLSWRDGNPVRLRDIAEIDMVLTDRTGIMRMNGDPAIAFNAQPAENVNVLDVMTDLKRAIVELNDRLDIVVSLTPWRRPCSGVRAAPTTVC